MEPASMRAFPFARPPLVQRPASSPPALARLQDRSSTSSWRELVGQHQHLGCWGDCRAPAPEATTNFDLTTLNRPHKVRCPSNRGPFFLSRRSLKLTLRTPRAVPGPPISRESMGPRRGWVRSRAGAPPPPLGPFAPTALGTLPAQARGPRARARSPSRMLVGATGPRCEAL